MYIVYKILNNFDSRYYIGVHKLKINDNYWGSGIKISRLINKYGVQNFRRITLFEFDNRIDALDKEREILKGCLNDINCINISIGGNGGSVKGYLKHSENSKNKMRQKAIGRKYSKETNIKKANWCRNKTYNEIYKENAEIEKLKRSLSHIGKHFTMEHRLKLSNIAKLRVRSEKTKIKQSESLKKYWALRKLVCV